MARRRNRAGEGRKASQHRCACLLRRIAVVGWLLSLVSNCQYWPFKHLFAGDLRDLIATFAHLPSHPRVFVCEPVPAYAVQWDITPEVIKNQIIPIIRQVAQEKNVTVINPHAPLTRRPELFPDFIHPNEGGAAIIARTLHGALLTPP